MDVKDVNSLVKSKGYTNASRKVDSFMQRLNETSNKKELMKIRDEKAAFFESLRKSDPGLYEVFRIDDKTIGEILVKKISGKDVVID